MSLRRGLRKLTAILLGVAVVTVVARDRLMPAALPLADDCLSASGINACDGDIVVLTGDDATGRRIWLAPGRSLPPDAAPPYHACHIPNLPGMVTHRLVPGVTVWGCVLPPRLRD